jgi:hypothetical protein
LEIDHDRRTTDSLVENRGRNAGIEGILLGSELPPGTDTCFGLVAFPSRSGYL